MLSVQLHSLSDTERFAKTIAGILEGGEMIALLGELGAGKTTFTRYLISELGGPPEVTSPTFVLAAEYDVRDGLVVEHWDLYRLSAAPEELHDLGSDKLIRIIEWCDRDQDLLSSVDLQLSFHASEDGKRVVLVSGKMAGRVKRN